MVEYKLIKKYPDSPELGTKIFQWNYLKISGKTKWNYDTNRGPLLDFKPEEYPEYWQKVEELCVPIGTKFKHNSDDIIYTIVSIKNDDVTISWCKYSETWDATHSIDQINDLFKQKTWIVLEEDYFENQPLFSAKDIEKMWAEVIFSRVVNLEVQLKKELKKKLDEKVNGN